MGNPQIIFWVSLCLGVGYTFIALLMGSIGDVGSDTGGGDVGSVDTGIGDLGNTSRDAGGDFGSSDVGDASGSVDYGSTHMEAGPSFGAHLMSFLSPMILSIFATGFGAFGLIAYALSKWFEISVGFGILGGLGLTIVLVKLLRSIYGKAEITSHLHSNELIGMDVEVSTTIPKQGTGYVCIESFGSRQTLPARIEHPDDQELETIPRGSRVRIRHIDGGTAFVSLID
jgi:membrane protein implicated in regulation of membrane protease activity